MPWVNRPRSPAAWKAARTEPTPAETLAAFQAAVDDRLSSPGHRPSASALGLALPTRWAGLSEPPRLYLRNSQGEMPRRVPQMYISPQVPHIDENANAS